MPLNIKNEDTHLRAKQLAELMNTSITEAVDVAIREAVKRRRSRQERRKKSMIAELKEIAEQTQDLPVYDVRRADEIIGYNDEGIPN